MTPSATTTTKETMISTQKWFSADLIALAKHHIGFLRSLHAHGTTLSRPSGESLRRYRELWLRLVHAHPTVPLIPPADIAWLWHCHRLAPSRYSSYCEAQFPGGTILEANPPFTAQFANWEAVYLDCDEDELRSIAVRTAELWSIQYPDETFHLMEEGVIIDCHADSPSSSPLLDGFDLLSSTSRQGAFLWQISRPSYNDPEFLREGLNNYIKFLHLKSGRPDLETIVPTYQTDLMWHTHMLNNIQRYHVECRAICGSRLNHDDSLDDRTEGGELDRAFNATRAAWRELHGEDYHVEGGMYRGEPPAQFYRPSFVMDSTRDGLSGNWSSSLDHPYTKYSGIQGASSTNPSGDADGVAERRRDVVWCWKESSQTMMSTYSPADVFGDPADCWIKYSAVDNETIEAVYQQLLRQVAGIAATVRIGNGAYLVDLSTMKQTKLSTKYVRDVQRFVKTTFADGRIATTIDASVVLAPPTDAATTRAADPGDLPVAFPAPAVRWTGPDGFTPDGRAGFIPPTRFRANLPKPDYVYGHGSKGRGFYHVTTRDAYVILHDGARARTAKLRREIDTSRSRAWFGPPSKTKAEHHARQERELADLDEYEKRLYAQSTADAPLGGIGGLLSPPPAPTRSVTPVYYRDRHPDGARGYWSGGPYWFGGGGGGGGCGGGGCGGGCGGGG
jgi:hypothetical protein